MEVCWRETRETSVRTRRRSGSASSSRGSDPPPLTRQPSDLASNLRLLPEHPAAQPHNNRAFIHLSHLTLVLFASFAAQSVTSVLVSALLSSLLFGSSYPTCGQTMIPMSANLSHLNLRSMFVLLPVQMIQSPSQPFGPSHQTQPQVCPASGAGE